MKPKLVVLVGVVLLLLAVVLAFGQGQLSRGHRFGPPAAAGANAGRSTTGTPPTPPTPEQMVQNRVNRLATVLSLTDDQKAKATTIFTAGMKAEQPLRQQMQAARKVLLGAVKANKTGQIDQAANTIGALTAQTTATSARTEAQFYALLTADQQAKLPNGFFGALGGAGRGGPGARPGPAGRGGAGFAPMMRRSPATIKQ
jgi:Spy/CpxP family protein refolding chaperone